MKYAKAIFDVFQLAKSGAKPSKLDVMVEILPRIENYRQNFWIAYEEL
jgi:hypothetical protein